MTAVQFGSVLSIELAAIFLTCPIDACYKLMYAQTPRSFDLHVDLDKNAGYKILPKGDAGIFIF